MNPLPKMPTDAAPAEPRAVRPAPARRWFQFHLATGVVLMFVAGGLLWANIRAQDLGPSGVVWVRTGDPVSVYGWPYRAVLLGTFGPDTVHVGLELDSSHDLPFFWDDDEGMIWYWLLPNAGVGLGILAAAALACEWTLRRRARSDLSPE